jgi:hypothetical protein
MQDPGLVIYGSEQGGFLGGGDVVGDILQSWDVASMGHDGSTIKKFHQYSRKIISVLK